MQTLSDLLGIDLPIIQAPMAGAQGAPLAIAVSHAGALGSLPCAMLSADAVRSELVTIRAQTKTPINVNFFCHEEPAPNETCELRWREKLAPYYKELGFESGAPPAAAQRRPFNAEAADV